MDLIGMVALTETTKTRHHTWHKFQASLVDHMWLSACISLHGITPQATTAIAYRRLLFH